MKKQKESVKGVFFGKSCNRHYEKFYIGLNLFFLVWGAQNIFGWRPLVTIISYLNKNRPSNVHYRNKAKNIMPFFLNFVQSDIIKKKYCLFHF